jgi:hypothetical protein
MKPLIVAIADTHIGSATSLAIDGWEDQDEKGIMCSKGQLWLGGKWEKMLMMVEHFKKKLSTNVYVFHLGDVVDGTNPKNRQCLPYLLDQELMAIEILGSLRDLADDMWIAAGTAWHIETVAQTEKRIARELNAHIDYIHRVDIDGILHDLRHHGRTSSRPYYSMAASVAAEVIMECSERGEPVPRFIWRAHRHRVNDSGAHFSHCRCIVLPSWKMHSQFEHRAAPERVSHLGYAVCQGENVHIQQFMPAMKPITKVE